MLENTTKEQKIMLLGLAFLIAVGLGVTISRQIVKTPVTDKILVDEKAVSDTTAGVSIVVDVSGAVRQPGVYKLTYGSRMLDAINAAGGELKNADLASLNLAEKVVDGAKIEIPRISRESSGTGISSGSSVSEKIRVNSATEAELDALPGVGPAMAKKIVDYRKQHGAFSKLADLTNVSGIGEKKLKKWEKLITL